MGISKLNAFIKKHSNVDNNRTSISLFSNTKIAVDISMYLYQFKRKRSTIPDMFSMCSVFRKYNIHPIFVFDGKPPESKSSSIEKRNMKKMKYEKQYEKLKQQYSEFENIDSDESNHKKEEITKKMHTCRNKSIRISKKECLDIQKLLDSYGMSWVQCKGEADIICAYLNKKKYVDYVLSDDTDMFPLGCKNVLRSLNILNHTVDIYNLDTILHSVNLTLEEFQIFCLSYKKDSDTIIDRHGKNLFDYYNDFIINKESLVSEHKYNNIFNLEHHKKDTCIQIPEIKNKRYCIGKVFECLKQHDFIFYDK